MAAVVRRFKRLRMTKDRVTVFEITPKPDIRQVQSDQKLYDIGPTKLKMKQRQLEKQESKGEPVNEKLKAWVNAGIKRLDRLIKLQEYKRQVREMALEMGFKIPNAPFGVIFYLPVPKSWSAKKKREHHYVLIDKRPDMDNLFKAFLDALNARKRRVPRRDADGKIIREDRRIVYDIIQLDPLFAGGDDRYVNNASLSKRYVNAEKGYIEFVLLPSPWDDAIIKMKLAEE